MNHYHRPEKQLDPAKLPGQIVNDRLTSGLNMAEHKAEYRAREQATYLRDIVARIQQEEAPTPVLEERYYVVKKTDLLRLPDAEYGDFLAIVGMVRQHRRNAGKPPLETVVVEKDWPEFAPTVASLLSRAM